MKIRILAQYRTSTVVEGQTYGPCICVILSSVDSSEPSHARSCCSVEQTLDELVRLCNGCLSLPRHADILFLIPRPCASSATPNKIRYSTSTYLLFLAAAKQFGRMSILPADPGFCDALTSDHYTSVVLSDAVDRSSAKRKRSSSACAQPKHAKKPSLHAPISMEPPEDAEPETETKLADLLRRLQLNGVVTDLDRMMMEEDVSACFLAYLQQFWAAENWLFYRTATKVLQLESAHVPPASQWKAIAALMQEYVDEGAKHRVNLSSALYDALHQATEQKNLSLLRASVVKAKSMVAFLLHQNYVGKFAQSRELFACLSGRV